MDKSAQEERFSCTVSSSEHKKIIMAHGGGGRLTSKLLRNYFLPQFKNEFLEQEHDGAVLNIEGKKLAFSCDSFVVQPAFFPGGNIGDLAVNGTVNDLCMCGAKPLYLSAGFILEEGFSLEDLNKIIASMRISADTAAIQIVTGDTKVVERGKGDGIYINTAGIGVIDTLVNISPGNCKPGDVIILSGSIAEHGIAILSARNSFRFRTTILSDTASLNLLTCPILEKFPDIHMMRDPTRGGLSSALNEIAKRVSLGIEIDESRIPLKEEVKGICELLGFDPLYVANEGKAIIISPQKDAAGILSLMKENPLGRDSEIIGRVVEEHPGIVVMRTVIGTNRIVDMLSGEQLPRIC